MSLSRSNDVDVLVVGAGPVGLTLASELRRHGVSCRIIDRSPEPASSSRALGVFNRTLEAFGQMGIAEEVMARGQRAQQMNVYADGKHMVGFQFAIHAYETPYEYPLFCSQVAVEQVLTKHLASYGVQVERGFELVSFIQGTNDVVATVRGNDGQEHVIHAGWLAGCDGAHSRVRKQLQLPFEGTPDETWMVVDVNLDWHLPKDSLYAFLSSEGTVVAFPFPEGKRWRLLETVVGEKTDSASVAARFTHKINEVYRDEQVVVPEPLWMSAFTIQQRHVPNMRAGRCFVVGDAAHVHSPASGQGMNTGIQDAFNLAWKLGLVIRGQAQDRLLDSYSAERKPVAERVLNGSLTFTRVVGRNSSARQYIRNLLLRTVNTVPALHQRVNRRITKMLSELDLAYKDSSIVAENWQGTGSNKVQHAGSDVGLAPGTRVPDIHFSNDQDLFTLMKGTQHTALLLTGLQPDQERLTHVTQLAAYIQQQYSEEIHLFLMTPSSDAQRELQKIGTVLLDSQSTLHHRLGAQTTTLYLLRPDGYVGYRSQSAEIESIDRYIADGLGLRTSVTMN